MPRLLLTFGTWGCSCSGILSHQASSSRILLQKAPHHSGRRTNWAALAKVSPVARTSSSVQCATEAQQTTSTQLSQHQLFPPAWGMLPPPSHPSPPAHLQSKRSTVKISWQQIAEKQLPDAKVALFSKPGSIPMWDLHI